MPQKSYLGYCASLQPFYTQAALGMPWNLQCTQALWDRPSEKENALYLHSQCLALEEAHRVRPGLLFCWNCSSWHCVTVSHEAALFGSVSCEKIFQPLTPLPRVNTAFSAWLLDSTSTVSAAALRPALQAEHLQFQTHGIVHERIP